MTLTTPAPESYTRFACPHPHWARCNRPGAGNIAHRSWTGTHQHSARLRCTTCDRACSERAGTLMARSQLPEDPLIQLVQCQRWGGCAAGTADIGEVDRKTGYRCQRVATQRAQLHPQQVVRDVDGPGVPLEEAMPHGVPNRWHGCIPHGPWGVGASWGATVARVPRTRQPRCSRRSWRARGPSHCCSPTAGRPLRRHCCKAWGAWAGRPSAPVPVGSATEPVVRPGEQGPPPGGPGRGGQAARRLRWPTPFWPAVAPAPPWHDDPDGLQGTLVWHRAWAGGTPAAPHPVSVLEPHASPGEGLARGQPVPRGAAASKPAPRAHTAQPSPGERSD